MVTALTEGFVNQTAFQKIETQEQVSAPALKDDGARILGRQLTAGAVHTDDIGNPIVVSKDFILNLLSLAIGGPPRLEGNLGKSVDLKV